ncbi:methyltransferase domain-containing protein [Methylobacter sp. Wu8]|uniref:methyltransferase domain-containing protein n=1 Tax=Methylobacter sp. Wu8 TaxID=3118457 RepID=UPI002F32C5FC
MTIETGVLQRYSEGAEAVQPELCCPVDYDRELLALLPQEIIDKDYGCGDPSRYVQKGDVVLDLGSGSGKICYMAAQLVGDSGKVIGVDMNDDMLNFMTNGKALPGRWLKALNFVRSPLPPPNHLPNPVWTKVMR